MLQWTIQQLFWRFTLISVSSTCLVTLFAIILTPSPPPCSCQNCPNDPTISQLSLNDITFFTVPRPHQDQNTIQKNLIAFSSWLASSPKAKIRLYVDEHDYDPTGLVTRNISTVFGENRLTFGGYLHCDTNDIPLIDDWFIRGIHDATTKLVCFINADILLSPGWFKKVKQTFLFFNDDTPLVLINQRIDFEMHNIDINITKNILYDIEQIVNNSWGEVHSPLGIDTFTFRADRLPFDPESILPFLIGRYNWDNWLIGYLNRKAVTVSFLVDPPVYHINHIRHRFDENDDKVLVNHFLRKSNRNYFGSNEDTTYQIIGEKISRTGLAPFFEYDLPQI